MNANDSNANGHIRLLCVDDNVEVLGAMGLLFDGSNGINSAGFSGPSRKARIMSFTSAACSLGYYAFVTVDTWIFQRYASQELERRMLVERTAPSVAST